MVTGAILSGECDARTLRTCLETIAGNEYASVNEVLIEFAHVSQEFSARHEPGFRVLCRRWPVVADYEDTPLYARLKPSISSLYIRMTAAMSRFVFPGILVLHHLAEGRRHDLPGLAELVLQPAALPLFAPLGEPFPETVLLGLRAATHGQ